MKKNKMKLFVIISRNIVDEKSIDKARKEFKDYNESKLNDSSVIFRGLMSPDHGSISVRQAKSRQDIWDIITKSPFYKNNLSDYEIHELEYKSHGTDLGLEYFDKFSTKSDK